MAHDETVFEPDAAWTRALEKYGAATHLAVARRGSAIVRPPLRNRRALQEMPLALQEGQHERGAPPEAQPSAASHGEPDPAPDRQRRRDRAVLLRRGLGP